ncbi:S1 family peptidase [Micromonospora zhanjiangensis]|uniref:S1 family peptidase n=1 Tax=Micromonospora zhanjiangensis TaxID=1522057 RepID=A0ABV8KTT0_9ACTN
MQIFTRRRRLTAGLFAAAGALLALVPAGAAHAIANGTPVPEGQYRFSVKLTMTGIPTADGGRRNSACSGALIAPQWILTAGHCFRDADGVRVDRPVADLTTATVGRADLTGSNGHVATVIAVRQSPSNDIAVAKLDTPITDIRPIRLATTAPAVNSVVRLTGYGSTDGTVIVPATQLHTGQFTVTSVAATTLTVTGHAPQRDTSPCPYDSGAPYFVESRNRQPVLVSVESDGPDCPHSLDETTSRVDVVRRWIQTQVAKG